MFEYGRQTDFAHMDSDWFETVEKKHGRVETRRCTAVSCPEFIAYLNEREQWSNVRSVAMVESEYPVEFAKNHIAVQVVCGFLLSSEPDFAALYITGNRFFVQFGQDLHAELASFGHTQAGRF